MCCKLLLAKHLCIRRTSLHLCTVGWLWKCYLGSSTSMWYFIFESEGTQNFWFMIPTREKENIHCTCHFYFTVKCRAPTEEFIHNGLSSDEDYFYLDEMIKILCHQQFSFYTTCVPSDGSHYATWYPQPRCGMLNVDCQALLFCTDPLNNSPWLLW